MEANESVQTWKQALGAQIRLARERSELSQQALANAVGLKHRNSIMNYEAGHDAPHVDVLAEIAHVLGLTSFNINGFRFSVAKRVQDVGTPAAEQLLLDYEQEYEVSHATVRIRPNRTIITITAFAETRTLKRVAATGTR